MFLGNTNTILESQNRKIFIDEKRKVIVHQFIKRNLELGWTIPMTFMNRTIALNSKVKGYKIAPSLVLNTDWRGVWVED